MINHFDFASSYEPLGSYNFTALTRIKKINIYRGLSNYLTLIQSFFLVLHDLLGIALESFLNIFYCKKCSLLNNVGSTSKNIKILSSNIFPIKIDDSPGTTFDHSFCFHVC